MKLVVNFGLIAFSVLHSVNATAAHFDLSGQEIWLLIQEKRYYETELKARKKDQLDNTLDSQEMANLLLRLQSYASPTRTNPGTFSSQLVEDSKLPYLSGNHLQACEPQIDEEDWIIRVASRGLLSLPQRILATDPADDLYFNQLDRLQFFHRIIANLSRGLSHSEEFGPLARLTATGGMLDAMKEIRALAHQGRQPGAKPNLEKLHPELESLADGIRRGIRAKGEWLTPRPRFDRVQALEDSDMIVRIFLQVIQALPEAVERLKRRHPFHESLHAKPEILEMQRAKLAFRSLLEWAERGEREFELNGYSAYLLKALGKPIHRMPSSTILEPFANDVLLPNGYSPDEHLFRLVESVRSLSTHATEMVKVLDPNNTIDLVPISSIDAYKIVPLAAAYIQMIPRVLERSPSNFSSHHFTLLRWSFSFLARFRKETEYLQRNYAEKFVASPFSNELPLTYIFDHGPQIQADLTELENIFMLRGPEAKRQLWRLVRFGFMEKPNDDPCRWKAMDGLVSIPSNLN